MGKEGRWWRREVVAEPGRAVARSGGVAAAAASCDGLMLVMAVAPGVEVRVGGVERITVGGDHRGGRGKGGWPGGEQRRLAQRWAAARQGRSLSHGCTTGRWAGLVGQRGDGRGRSTPPARAP
jgi:hypothetical protein